MDRIELYYDTGSPFSLLAYHVLVKLQHQWNAQLVLRPVALGMLFKMSGNDFSVGKCAAKQRHAHKDIERTATLHGIDNMVTTPTRFPTSSLQAQRILTAIKQQFGDEMLHEASLAIWNAYWVCPLCTLPCHRWSSTPSTQQRDQDIAQPTVLHEALCTCMDDAMATRLVEHDCKQPDVKAALVATTKQAAEAGAFGAPTMLVTRAADGCTALFFGCDRFDHIAAFLGRAYVNPTADPFARARL